MRYSVRAILRPPPDFDTASRTFFDACEAAGALPTPGMRRVYDDFIRELKAVGVWTLLDVIKRHDVEASAAALINIKNPGTFDSSLVNSPTFTALRHFATNGTNSEVDLGFNPSTAGGNFTQDSASFVVRFASAGAFTTVSPAGWFDGTDGIAINPRGTADAVSFRLNQAANTTCGTNTTGIGLQGPNRSASNATQYYRSGVSVAATANANQTSTALNNSTLRLGRLTTTGYQACSFVSAYAGGSLTAQQHADLRLADLRFCNRVGSA